MKYFIDTELLEGSQDKTFLGVSICNTKPTIDLISIGMCTDDGREYYAISKDFNLKEAWNRYEDSSPEKGLKLYWIRDNVLKPIWEELVKKESEYYLEMWRRVNILTKYIDGDYYEFTYKELKRLIKKYGKTNKQISEEVIGFVTPTNEPKFCVVLNGKRDITYQAKKRGGSLPEFYGYYADYDWVAFCWLFGKMMDLPKGFPMYCNDLKQMLDDKIKDKVSRHCRLFHKQLDANAFNDGDLTEALAITKALPNYPKQTNEHNALSDAIFNRDLYYFLKSL